MVKKSDEFEISTKKVYISITIVVAIVVVFFAFKILIFGHVSEDQAQQNLVEFFEREIPDSVVQVLESSRQGDFYEFIITIDGEEFPFYVTLDGKYATVDMISLE